MFEVESRVEAMQIIAEVGVIVTLDDYDVRPADAAAYVAAWQRLDEGNRDRMQALALDDAIEFAWRIMEEVQGGVA